MSNIRKLDMDELEQVTGGENRTVQTGNYQNAAVRRDPTSNKVIASLGNGTVVNTIGDPQYFPETGRNWVKVEFIDKNGTLKTGWIAASILGFPR